MESAVKIRQKDGFDKRNLLKNDKYKMEVELPYGTILIRYGSEVGKFTARKGTKYESLALPYMKDTVEYNEYKVIANGVKVICIVEKGKIAPGFDSDGGAVQFMHSVSIRESMKRSLYRIFGK